MDARVINGHVQPSPQEHEGRVERHAHGKEQKYIHGKSDMEDIGDGESDAGPQPPSTPGPSPQHRAMHIHGGTGLEKGRITP